MAARKQPSTRLRLLLVLSSAVLALAVSEVGLRLVLPAPQSHFVYPPHTHRVFQPVPGTMPGIQGVARFVVNSAGLRGDELDPRQTFRVLTLGGSTTECLFLDQEEAWPALVQKRLEAVLGEGRAWVGNAGMSGRSSKHHVVQARHLLDQLPRIDALVVLAINDLLLRLQAGDTYLPVVARALEPGSETWADGAETRRPFAIMESEDGVGFRSRTGLGRLLDRFLYVLSPETVVPPMLVQDRAGRIYVTWRRHRQAASSFLQELPDLTSALDAYEGNLGLLIDAAAARNVRVVLMTHPALWKEEMPPSEEALLWMGGVGEYQRRPGQPYYAPGALRRGLEALNARTLEICRKRRVECVDLDAAMSSTAENFYDDAHFTEAGARHVAEALSERLIATLPAPPVRSGP